MPAIATFGADIAFLRDHVETVVLGTDPRGPRVAVVPSWQGRVMTSSAAGDDGASHGFINRTKVIEGVTPGSINVFGGEDRLWLGPEGGQHSIFFAPGRPFTLEHWQTPAAIDAEPYALVARDDACVRFVHEARFTNASGTGFQVGLDRAVSLLGRDEAATRLGAAPGEARLVAYESRNRLTNAGGEAWRPARGLLSIWILGMFRHGPATTVVIPIREDAGGIPDAIVNDAYFGTVPADRLVVRPGTIYFRADGRHRSKIGVGPRRARPACGSWDAERGVLTVVQYNQPGPEVTAYVNSMWEIQDEPYAGDVVNSYNDGPPAPGAAPLGPFYELETSSPALALAAGETATHVHRTFHLEGERAELDRISRVTLGVGLDEIETALPS